MLKPFSLHLRTAILKIIVAIALLTLCLSSTSSLLSAKENPLLPNEKPAWLEGTGENLKIKIAGEVLDEKGNPVNDFKLSVELYTLRGPKTQSVKIERNQFHFWVPVGSENCEGLQIDASSADGKKVISQTVSNYEFRQAAIDGLKLRLLPPERTLEVLVHTKDKPVPGAHVAALVDGVIREAKTDQAGIARFGLMNQNFLNKLTCWTDSHQIGVGDYILPLDVNPLVDKHRIEVFPARTQTIRVFDKESKAPSRNLPIRIGVNSGSPDHLSLSLIRLLDLKTNEKGEATFDWMPNWKNPKCSFEILDPNWIKTDEEQNVGGVIHLTAKKSQRDQRRRFVGQLTSSQLNKAGILVEMMSFQREIKSRSEFQFAFTDEKGRFSAQCLPGATYCMGVNDSRYVSKQIDLIPISKDKIQSPELPLSMGRSVEVKYTAGPTKKPVANQSILLSIPHRFSWREDGQTRQGEGGRTRVEKTDDRGSAQIYVLEGAKLQVSIYGRDWNSTQKIEVKSDGLNKLEFHQEFPEARKITGRLRLEDSLKADLNEATVEIGSLDGETNERMTLNTNQLGEFEFQSKSTLLGIFARTKDGKAAIVSKIDRFTQQVDLNLKPTASFRGQVLWKENKPLGGVPINLQVIVSEKTDDFKLQNTRFVAATMESTTNEKGIYSFAGLPPHAEIDVKTGPKASYPNASLENFRLEPNETLPLVISRLETPTQKQSFAMRYASVLRDCSLSNYHTMVILDSDSKQNREFVNENFLDYETNNRVGTFMQLHCKVEKESADPEVIQFARDKNWLIPEKGKIVAIAIDGKGQELARIEINPSDSASPKHVAEFLEKNAPKKLDAKKKWDEAFAQAKASNRKVWVRISGRYCNPCFRLTRWLDDQQTLIFKDYVVLKIDENGDLNASEVAKRLIGSEVPGSGIPFHAIFDANEKLIITSASPLRNIGFPSGIEGKKHIRKMFMQTRKNLSDQQLEDLISTLED